MASELRSLVFAQKKPKTTTVSPAYFNGQSIELREMSVGARRDLIANSTDENDERDAAHFEALVVIACAFDPKNGEQVFGEADRDMLVSLPASVLDELAAPALEINGLLVGSVDTARKNSSATPSASTNTDSPNASA